jgi:hypothetical protein
MGSEAELALAVHSVQEALISTYENNCPLRTVRRQEFSQMVDKAGVTQRRGETALK